MVLDDGSADATGPLIEPIVVPLDRIAGPVPSLVRVQPGPVGLQQGTAVKLIGAVLGNHQHLRAAVTSILSAVRIRLNSDFLYRFLMGVITAAPPQARLLTSIPST